MRLRILICWLLSLSGLPATAQTFGDASDQVFVDDVLSVVRITLAPGDLAVILDPANAQSDVEYLARFEFESPYLAATFDSVGFRLRGNTSRVAQKKSFRVSFNTFIPGGDFRGLEKLNLNGEHNDPSIMRSKLSWDLFAGADVPASRSAHLQLYINGDYFGLYMNIEHVDERFLRRRFGNDDGFLYKCLWPADLTYVGPTADAYRPSGSDRRPYDLQLGRDDQEGYHDLAALITTINQTPAAEFATEIERVFDVNGFLRYLAVTVATGSWDSYWFLKNNFYLYNDPAIGRFRFIPYDYDNSFGIWWEGIWPGLDWSSRNVYQWGHPIEQRPLTRRILAVPEFRERFTLYLKRLLADGFASGPLKERALALRDLTASAAEQDLNRVLDYGFTVQDYYDSFTVPLADRNERQGHVRHGLLPFIDARHASASTQLDPGNIAPVVSDVTVTPNPARTVDAVEVRVRVEDEDEPIVRVAYGLGGLSGQSVDADPAPGLGRDVWRAVLPPTGSTGMLELQVRAVDDQGAERRGSVITVSVDDSRPPLFVNEFMALNETTLADEAGDFDDWVELYNAGLSPVSLGGLHLTDDLSDPGQWTLPDITVAAGGYQILWVDGSPEQGLLHGPFRLSGDGEVLALLDAAGAVLDQITFGAQVRDVSYGRSVDGGGSWSAMVSPTPGGSNADATGLRLDLPRDEPADAWPNPFWSRLTLSARGPYRVSILDLLGREVAALKGWQDGPTEWDGRDAAGRLVPPGLYFVRIHTESGALEGDTVVPVVKAGH